MLNLIADMRVIREINNAECKISIFSWNQKYLIKLEKGPFEQTFKVSEMDVLEEELDEILNETFILEAMIRFEDMQVSLQKSIP